MTGSLSTKDSPQGTFRRSLAILGLIIGTSLVALVWTVAFAAGDQDGSGRSIPPCVTEDGGPIPCRWDCRTMGNLDCGPSGAPPVTIIRETP